MRMNLPTGRVNGPLRKGLTLAAGSFLLAALGETADHGQAAAPAPAIAMTSVCPRGDRTCVHPVYSPEIGAILGKPFTQTTATLPPAIARTIPTRPVTQIESAQDLPDMEFNSYATFAERLKDMRTLRVMTLWQSRRTQIYLGVNQRGLPGLHFCQRRDAVDRRALWHSATDTVHRNLIDGPALQLRSVAP